MSRRLACRPARRLERLRDDTGQLTLLVVGFFLIAALLVTVVVNASRVFLTQRALSAAADGAALAAADSLDELAFYRTGGHETLPLSEAAAAAAVGAYADSAGLAGRFPGFAVTSAVSPDGSTVTVTASTVVELPMLNVVSERYAAGYPVAVTASARSPLAP